MSVTLAALPKGHEFPCAEFELTDAWVADYVAAVEDEAIATLDCAVPPMAIATLSIRALLESTGLPDGAIHVAQELAFHRAVGAGERLTTRAAVASRGERQHWVLMSVDLIVDGDDGRSVMTGRATVSFPLDASVEPELQGEAERPPAPATATEFSSIAKSITQEKINRYAVASGDHNPLHIDPEFAARSRFGGTIAHGMLVLAYVSELMEVQLGPAWVSGGRLKVRFRGAARPGDTVTTTTRAAQAGKETSVYNVECRNQRGEMLISGTAEARAT